MSDLPILAVGDAVQKCKGYKWPGIVVAVFKTLAGAERFVVECTVPEVKGALHIYNREQLEPRTATRSGVMPEVIADLALNLTNLERKLLLDESDGWGSWMWDVGRQLVSKGLADQVAGKIEWNDLGLDVIDHLKASEK